MTDLRTLLGLVKYRLSASSHSMCERQVPEFVDMLGDGNVYLLPGADAPFPGHVPPSEVFTSAGREAMVDDLLSRAIDSRSSVALVLWGVEGVGKTAVARELCRRARRAGQFPPGIFWLNAGTPVGLELGLRKLMTDHMGLRTKADTCSVSEAQVEVHTWLRRNPGWLLVVDNASVPVVEDYWLLGTHGVVVFTTLRSVARSVQPAGASLGAGSGALAEGPQLLERQVHPVSPEDGVVMMVSFRDGKAHTSHAAVELLVGRDSEDMAALQWLASPEAASGLPCRLQKYGCDVQERTGETFASYSRGLQALLLAPPAPLPDPDAEQVAQLLWWLSFHGFTERECMGPELVAAGVRSLEALQQPRAIQVIQSLGRLKPLSRSKLTRFLCENPVEPPPDKEKVEELWCYMSALGLDKGSQAAVTKLGVVRLDHLRRLDVSLLRSRDTRFTERDTQLLGNAIRGGTVPEER
jgi:hypothetical protein